MNFWNRRFLKAICFTRLDGGRAHEDRCQELECYTQGHFQPNFSIFQRRKRSETLRKWFSQCNETRKGGRKHSSDLLHVLHEDPLKPVVRMTTFQWGPLLLLRCLQTGAVDSKEMKDRSYVFFLASYQEFWKPGDKLSEGYDADKVIQCQPKHPFSEWDVLSTSLRQHLKLPWST